MYRFKMNYLSVILATLFALVQSSAATSLYDVTFQNEGAYSIYVEHLWFAIGGKDVPVPIDSAIASFNQAKEQGIVPTKAVADLTFIDSNKDGLISHQELYDNTKLQMQSTSVTSKVPSIAKSLNDSHLQASHKSAQVTFCNTTNPTSSMTIADGKSCLKAGDCVSRYMPCQAKSSRLQRRNFWSTLALIVVYATVGVLVGFVALYLAVLSASMPIVALPLLAVWVIFWAALDYFSLPR